MYVISYNIIMYHQGGLHASNMSLSCGGVPDR